MKIKAQRHLKRLRFFFLSQPPSFVTVPAIIQWCSDGNDGSCQRGTGKHESIFSFFHPLPFYSSIIYLSHSKLLPLVVFSLIVDFIVGVIYYYSLQICLCLWCFHSTCSLFFFPDRNKNEVKTLDSSIATHRRQDGCYWTRAIRYL